MWTTQWQTDTWINIGDGQHVLEEWVRVSSIERIRMVEGAKRAVVILKSGVEIPAGYTAQELMKRISDAMKVKD